MMKGLNGRFERRTDAIVGTDAIHAWENLGTVTLAALGYMAETPRS